MKIKIKKLNSKAILPEFKTEGSAGADLSACLESSVILKSGERKLIPLGWAVEIPCGFEAQIRARSGLSLKNGICLANGIGTIDADYRGEVGVILINLSNEDFEITHGMRIAQMVFSKFEKVEFSEVEILTESSRDTGGFGSTGVK